MSLWGIPFDYIEEHWTDRQYFMMVDRACERLERERRTETQGKRMTLSRFINVQRGLVDE